MGRTRSSRVRRRRRSSGGRRTAHRPLGAAARPGREARPGGRRRRGCPRSRHGHRARRCQGLERRRADVRRCRRQRHVRRHPWRPRPRGPSRHHCHHFGGGRLALPRTPRLRPARPRRPGARARPARRCLHGRAGRAPTPRCRRAARRASAPRPGLAPGVAVRGRAVVPELWRGRPPSLQATPQQGRRFGHSSQHLGRSGQTARRGDLQHRCQPKHGGL